MTYNKKAHKSWAFSSWRFIFNPYLSVILSWILNPTCLPIPPHRQMSLLLLVS